MPRRLITLATAALAVFGMATRSEAQPGVSFMPARQPPKTEIAAHLGVWALMDGGGELGARVTRNKKEWLAFEYGLSYRPGQHVRAASGLALWNVRLGVPHPTKPAVAFVTAGVAAGNSANYSVSPEVGFGVQFVPPPSPYGPPADSFLMLRAELQYFLRGRSLDDHGRLMISMVVSLGGRW